MPNLYIPVRPPVQTPVFRRLFRADRSQGPVNPASAVNSAAVGDVAWSNPGNAAVSDDVYATSILVAQTTQQLNATDFRFNIPSEATILGIIVAIEAKTSVGTNTSTARIIKGGSVGSTTKTNDWTTTETIFSYGGAADLWGETWTPTDTNASTFGVSVRIESGVTATPSVDAIRITVVYDVVVVVATTRPRRALLGVGF